MVFMVCAFSGNGRAGGGEVTTLGPDLQGAAVRVAEPEQTVRMRPVVDRHVQVHPGEKNAGGDRSSGRGRHTSTRTARGYALGGGPQNPAGGLGGPGPVAGPVEVDGLRRGALAHVDVVGLDLAAQAVGVGRDLSGAGRGWRRRRPAPSSERRRRRPGSGARQRSAQRWFSWWVFVLSGNPLGRAARGSRQGSRGREELNLAGQCPGRAARPFVPPGAGLRPLSSFQSAIRWASPARVTRARQPGARQR